MIKKRRFYRIYIPCYHFTENNPNCKNCADQYRCRRNGDGNPTMFEDPYKRYLMED